MTAFVYHGGAFTLGGKPFSVRSGAIHYFRIRPDAWYDRLLKLKECGFNTVETYIAWNVHEEQEGHFCITEENDFGKFLDIAASLGLYAVVRPGPYICAEWEAGGFPAWLFADKNGKVRCSDEKYLFSVKRYLENVFRVLKPRLLSNGGNVIMLQIENEYGSYGNDKRYLQSLLEMYRESGMDCLYFTSDGAERYMLSGGGVEGVLQSLNFGSKVEENMAILKAVQPHAPLFCSEFWCGWFDLWREEHHTRRAEEVVFEVEQFLKNGYSFNFYMFAGGTNFAFRNGAELYDGRYAAVTTSYDYNALLTEAGDRTEAYYAVRELFIRYGIDVPKLTATESKKRAYGKVRFTGVAPLFENLGNIGIEKRSALPLSMEEAGYGYGYILYSTVLAEGFDNLPLELKGLADRAVIFIDGERQGVYERGRESEKVLVDTRKKEKRLDILVENMGRVNFGTELFDRKGIEGVKIVCPLAMNFSNISLPMDGRLSKLEWRALKGAERVPCFYQGEFEAAEEADTFLALPGFKKGFVLINGFNVGRYYTEAGPQKTLYVPASCIRKGKNEIVLFDSDGANSLSAEFTDAPEWR